MAHKEGVYEAAKAKFDYNPLTGNIIHLSNRGNRVAGDIAGNINKSHGYILIRFKNISLRAHRLAFYIMEGYLPDSIDHINGNRADNKWLNIRSCTYAENGRNRGMSIRNTSGYRGVYAHEYSKWQGRVSLNGRIYSKFGFSTPELANDWVVAKSKELYGEFYNEGR